MKDLLLRLALGALVVLSAGAAFADVDPPGRVGRLSYVDGVVSFHTADQNQWSPATLNYPVVAGESFWTEPQARAEIQVGPAELRLDESTGLDIVALDDSRTHLGLAQGTINVHLRAMPPGGVEVLTAQGAVMLVEPGSYHIEAGQLTSDGPADRMAVSVLEGRAQVSGPRRSIDVLPGESAVLGGGAAGVTLAQGNSTPFDDWALERERREEAPAATRYVSPETTGYQDLDDYGQWRTEPTYGTVWYPAVPAADWAPYRYGHWAWVAPWGWTWVEDEPWGFAPFHYGRWAEVGGGWCWVPGPMVVRPVYAPALVVFVGGPRFGMSVSFGGGGGGVAWFPLGPREVYVPPYRTSERYVQKVNVTNTTVNVVNVTNVYNNVNVTKVTYMHQTNIAAVTAVSHDTFVNARPVGAATVRVNSQQLQTAEVQRGVAVAPARQSIVGTSGPAAVKPPEAVMSRQVVVKEAPPAPHVSYERQQQVLSSQPGRVPAPQQMDQLRRAQEQQLQPTVKVAPPARGNQSASQPGRVPPQQQTDQPRRPQDQPQQPDVKFVPPARGNQNASQPGRVPPQQQTDQPRRTPEQPQQPDVKFVAPARGIRTPRNQGASRRSNNRNSCANHRSNSSPL